MSEANFWNKGWHFFIVSLIFLGLGFKLCWTGISDIAEDMDLQNWHKAEALVESVKVEPVYEKGPVAGNRLVATYSYIFADQQKVANRVAIDPTFSNSPAELIDARKQLENAVKNKTPVMVLVDPKNPDNSLLFKPFPFKAYFFTLAGAALLAVYLLLEFLFVLKFKQSLLKNQRRSLQPDKPWRWEEQWQNFTIPAESQLSKGLPLFGFSLVVLLVSLTMIALILIQPGKGVEEYAGITFLVGFNLLLLFNCQKKWRGDSWAKAIELQASAFPVRPGEPWPFRIIITKARDMEIFAGIKVFLKFQQALGLVENGGTGRGTGIIGNSMAERLFVEDQKTCFCLTPEVKTNENLIMLELEACLPDDAPPTDMDGEFPGKWQIFLYFSKMGKEFIETFDIPVYPEDKFSETEINEYFDNSKEN